MVTRLGLLGVALLLALVACAKGEPEEATSRTSAAVEDTDMRLTSSAFEHEGSIPERYSCDGLDISPPLSISDIPAGTETLVLVMDDPDAPSRVWDHWVAYDIPVVTEIEEDVGSLGTLGRNSWGKAAYGGPCPPGGTHRYIFTLSALDTSLGLAPGADKGAVVSAAQGHVLAEASLMGRYSR